MIYFDTHAGRGKYVTGENGSPLVAVRALLNHSSREYILRNTEVIFYFIERDLQNLESLKAEIAALGQIPPQIKIECEAGESFDLLSQMLDSLDADKSYLAPSFVFIDPYGFKVPGSLLKRLMSHQKVELFINVIWRELDMAIMQKEKMAPGMRDTLTSIFSGNDWVQISDDTDFDSRAQKTVNLFRNVTAAKWATFIRMLGDNHKTRYMLVHLTNHDSGRDLIKDCLWAVCPDGGFRVRKDLNFDQEELLMLGGDHQDMQPLIEWLKAQLAGGRKSWNELNQLLRNELWRETHLWKLLSNLRKDKKSGLQVQCEDRFSKASNPTFMFGE